MSWLECLLPHPIPKEFGGPSLLALLESLCLLPLFGLVFLFLILCLRIVIYYLIYLRRPGRGKEYDLTEKLYVITGGTSGIGRQLAREIFKRNGSVILLARNPIAANEVRHQLRDEFPRSTGIAVPIVCDLTNLAVVRKAADLIMKTYERIDGLVNCAGIGSRAKYEATIDGYETVIQANCLGHALLSTVLSWGIQLTNGVVINVSSHVAHDTIPFDYANPFFDEKSYDGYQAYCRSKLMVNTFTMQAAKFTPEVCYLAVYPGIVFTPIGDQFVRSRSRIPALLPIILPITRTIFWLIGRTVKQGAETIWPLLVDPDLRPPSGYAVDTRFRAVLGVRLNKKKMNDEEITDMVDALNKAVASAIDKYVHPDKNAPKPPSPEGADEDMPIEDTPEEEAEAMLPTMISPFSITRRLSRRKDKIVQSIKGLARRSIRRESSSEVLREDSKTQEKETTKPVVRIITPEESAAVPEETPIMGLREKKKPALGAATAARAAIRRLPQDAPSTSSQIKKVDWKVTASEAKKARRQGPEMGKELTGKEKKDKFESNTLPKPKKPSRIRTSSDNTDIIFGRERKTVEKAAKIEERDESTSVEKKESAAPLTLASKFRIGSAESLDGKEEGEAK